MLWYCQNIALKKTKNMIKKNLEENELLKILLFDLIEKNKMLRERAERLKDDIIILKLERFKENALKLIEKILLLHMLEKTLKIVEHSHFEENKENNEMICFWCKTRKNDCILCKKIKDEKELLWDGVRVDI